MRMISMSLIEIRKSSISSYFIYLCVCSNYNECTRNTIHTPKFRPKHGTLQKHQPTPFAPTRGANARCSAADRAVRPARSRHRPLPLADAAVGAVKFQSN